MIIIISFNPSLDLVLDVSKFATGEIIRATSSNKVASGKGVNAAFAAAVIGCRSRLGCIVGSKDVGDFNDLHPLISCDLFLVEGKTRTNVTIAENKTSLVCHIQTAGPTIDHDVAEAAALQFVTGISNNDIVIVSGSMPAGVKQELLTNTLDIIARTGAVLIVDVDPVYWHLINWDHVQWAKPNIEELSRYCGRALESESDIVGAVKDCGLASHTVVSLGARGAILVSRNRAEWSHGQTRMQFTPTALPIGCGDSMVGGFAAALARGGSSEDVLKYGLSAGCANLAGTAPGRIDPAIFDQALRSVEISWNREE